MADQEFNLTRERPDASDLTTITFEQLRTMPTAPVAVVGAVVFQQSRSAAYRSAARGEIPTIRLGARLLVPIPQLLAMLEGREGSAA
jgi:hypothetical protein